MEVLDLTRYFNDPNCALFTSKTGYAISFYLRLSNAVNKKTLTELISLHGGRVEKEYKDMKCRTILLVDSKTYHPQLLDRIPFSASYVIDCVVKNTLLQLVPYAFCTIVTEPRENFMDVIFHGTREFKILNHNDPDYGQLKRYTIISTPEFPFKVPYNVQCTSANKQIRKDLSKVDSPKPLASTSVHQNSSKKYSEPKLYVREKIKIKIITNETDEEREDANSQTNSDINKKIKEKRSCVVVEENSNSSSLSSKEDDTDSNPKRATTKELAPTDMASVCKVIFPEMISTIKYPEKGSRNKPSPSKSVTVDTLSDDSKQKVRTLNTKISLESSDRELNEKNELIGLKTQETKMN